MKFYVFYVQIIEYKTNNCLLFISSKYLFRVRIIGLNSKQLMSHDVYMSTTTSYINSNNLIKM